MRKLPGLSPKRWAASPGRQVLDEEGAKGLVLALGGGGGLEEAAARRHLVDGLNGHPSTQLPASMQEA
jgi:hypothetical protein